MAWFDPATSYASGGLDRETGQNIPGACWQRLMDSLSALGGTTGRRLALRREWLKAADVASAATVDLSTVEGNYAHITGTTTITSFGTVNAGTLMTLEFDGILTVTHHATSLILAGATNLTTAAGTVLVLVSEGSGNWREVARSTSTPSVSARATHGANQSLAGSTATAIAFSAADVYDTNAIHDPSSNNTRMTIPAGQGGTYSMKGNVQWAANTTGQRQLYIRLNGGATLVGYDVRDPNAAGVTVQQVVGDYVLAAGDYVELVGTQSSGGALNVESGNSTPWFSIAKL